MYNAPNLMEFDLKNFFPSINHKKIFEVLRRIGIDKFNAT